MITLLILLAAALLVWMAATNRLKTFFAAMQDPSSVK